MRKNLIKEYDYLVEQLMVASCSFKWDEIISDTEGNYDEAIIILKTKLRKMTYPYVEYEEEKEEIFYSNTYNEACSIAERNRFLWFVRNPNIFCAVIKFSVIKKLKFKRR